MDIDAVVSCNGGPLLNIARRCTPESAVRAVLSRDRAMFASILQWGRLYLGEFQAIFTTVVETGDCGFLHIALSANIFTCHAWQLAYLLDRPHTKPSCATACIAYALCRHADRLDPVPLTEAILELGHWPLIVRVITMGTLRLNATELAMARHASWCTKYHYAALCDMCF